MVCRKFCVPRQSVNALCLLWLWCVMNATSKTESIVTETPNPHQCSIHILTSFSEHLSDYEKIHTCFYLAKNATATRKTVDSEKRQDNRMQKKFFVFVADTSWIQTLVMQHFSEELRCNICCGTWRMFL